MSSIGDERKVDEAEVRDVLAAHGLGTAAKQALALAFNHPLRVVWANPAAVALFGTDDPAEMTQHMFAGRGRDGLAAAVGRLAPDGGTRTERLRLFRGFQARTVPVVVSRTRLDDGEELVVLALPDAEDVSRSLAGDPFRSALRLPGDSPIRDTPPPEPPSGPAGSGLDARPEVPPALLEPADHLVPLGHRRFVWQTDGHHALMAAGGLPHALAACEPADEPWADRLAALAAEGASALGEALAAGRPFSHLTLLWPTADGGARVPVTMGAAPVRGAAGFRGFGIAHFASALRDPNAPVAAPVVTPAAQDLAPASAEGDEPSRSPAAPEEPAEVAEEPPVVEETSVEPLFSLADRTAGEGRASFGSANVVALRPLQVSNAAPEDEPRRRRGDAAPPQPASDEVPSFDLSSVEHFNFNEIGRTLRGELAGRDRGAPPTAAEAGTAALAALPVALVLSSGGRLVFANDAFLALTGYASLAALEEAGGLRHLLGGLDPTQVADARSDRAFPLLAASGQVIAAEGRVAAVPWEGLSTLALIVRAAPRPAEDARPVDASRASVAEAAEAAEAATLLDRVSDAVAVVDAQGRVLMVNNAAETLFGLAGSAMVGESVAGLLLPDAQSAALGAVLAAHTAGPGGDAASVAVTGRRAGGGALALAMTVRAIGPGRLGIVFRDNSEVEALRRDRERLQAELEQSAGVRADFLGRVSHEIRAPINAILGFAEIILDERFGTIGNARYKEYLSDIHAAGQQVIAYVDGLHDLSKMQAGRTEVTLAAVDTNRIVSEAVGSMQVQAHRERVIVRLSLAPHLPAALADERSLKQIMGNILSNAIAFNEPGGQVIVSTAAVDGGGIAVRVRDTGVGMSETELATVLEPVRQINLGQQGAGTGLGLPLTHALVEANRATMSIQSRKNEGTLVEVALAAAPAGERSNPAA